MNQKLSTPSIPGSQQINCETDIVGEQAKITIATADVESEDDEEEKYREALKKYEDGIVAIKQLRQELLETFKKSQDIFEKQLSYIAAGALGLSVGFIQEIVVPIKAAENKWMLVTGWAALIATLLINLISHIIAANYARTGAKEALDIEATYDHHRINRRSRRIAWINISTLVTLTGGIVLIVLFITFNAIYGLPDEKIGPDQKKPAQTILKVPTNLERTTKQANSTILISPQEESKKPIIKNGKE